MIDLVGRISRALARTSLVTTLLFAAVVVSMSGCERVSTGPTQETAYQRVLRTGVIRAAYINYPPAVMRDTANGHMSGIFVDTLNRAASDLGLRVEWTEEVGWGAQIEGLNANRYDIVGSPVWANPTRGKLTTLSLPIYYSGIGIYVRSTDNRFSPGADNSWDSVNQPNVRIATIDGETGDLIARTRFPKAQRVSLPQNADISQLFLEVADGHADVFFAEPYFALQYYKNNPHAVRNIAEQHPISTLGNVYMMRANEWQLQQALNVTLEGLLNSGFIDEELARYPGGETFYRVAPAYRTNP